MVASFLANHTDDDRLAELGDVLSGHTRHRGFRIDLLSFRTGEGWRPFALIKAATGALWPGMIVMDLVPTKAEADQLAAHGAREWIDKRFS